MEEEKKHERSFDLRSEKVRNIVGQIPSSLVRYGIVAIGIVLLCLFALVYFLPFKQVYNGAATVREIKNTPTDSIEIVVLLRFENKRPESINGQMICLQSPNGTFIGQLRGLSVVRDTLERQEALCQFKFSDIKSLRNQTVDFQRKYSSGNLLQKIMYEVKCEGE